MRYLIVSLFFIFNLGFGQYNSRTNSNRNDVLSIKPKNSESLITIQQIQKESNSSSIFWVEPRTRDDYAPSEVIEAEGSIEDWCGTMPWWESQNSDQRSCDFHGITDDPTVRDTFIPDANTEIKYLRLFIHAFADDSGLNPTITLADAEAQLYTLNETFSDYKIEFQAWFQIHNDTQYQYMTESEWDSAEVKETYAQDPTYYHNIYVTDLDPDWGILGRSTFPWDSDALTVFGGTIIHKDRFGGPRTFNGTANVTNHVATHELGHALGLWHTFHGVTEVTVCGTCYEGALGYTYELSDSADLVGDLCSDTKATPKNFNCADPDTFDCQNNNWINTDVHNFMGYGGDLCWNLNDDGFSSQQSGRAHGWATDKYEGLMIISEEMTLLSTGFEVGLPNDWTIIDDDNDGYQWGFYIDDETFDMSHYGAAGGAVYNYSATNSDYLITPLIEIPSNVASASFSFWAKSHSSDYPEDFVARISTDGTNFSSLGSTSSASSDWTQYSYDISSYIGQSVYLALHCVSTWGYYLMADDFLVTASLNASPLDAEFYASFTSGSVPITVDFTDLSTGSPTSWSWTFGDGGTSTLQNPTHTYENPGLYTVSLIVSDGSDSETETKTDYIDIAVPAANTLLTESFETYLPSDWTVIDNDGDGNQWGRFSDDGHDGSISMGVQWNNAGSDDWLITPQLTLTANCSISYSFWARSLSSSYLEDFNVKLSSVGNSVSDFTTTLEAVTSTPYSWTEYVYDLSEYAGQAIYLAVQRVSVGQYYLFVDDFELTADPLLIAGFTADDTTGVLPLTINFTDQSWGNPTSWSWNFGDSGTSADQNPAHTFQTAGSYSISLTVSNGTENDSLIKTDYISVISQTYVPDDNFEQALIDLGYDDTLDDYVVTDSISGVTSLDVGEKEISDLTGIEAFTALDVLYCDNNQLTSLDVSSNTALTGLWCNSNSLTSLDVSTNTSLTSLRCYDNQLTSLDVSANTALTYLYCYTNQLAALDVSANTALTLLTCSINELTALDVSNNTALTTLYCRSNQLTALDVSANTALTSLNCRNNQLTSLDVSANTALTYLICSINQLTYLNMRNGVTDALTTFNATNNDSLECIETLDTTYATENWTYENGNIDLGVTFAVNCTPGYTYVPDDNFEQALIDLGFDDTLDNFVVTDSINSVTVLNVSNDSISNLTGIEDFTNLRNLHAQSNQLTTMDLTNNDSLELLQLHENSLTSVSGISNKVNLDHLQLQRNELTSIDISGCVSLESTVLLYNNDLTSINLTGNVAMTHFNAKDNELTSIDLSTNDLLEEITLRNNALSELDLTNKPNMNEIRTTGNDSLSCIYVSDIEYAQENWEINIDEWTSLCQGNVFSGPIWHVSTVGSDSPGGGSDENPFATIQHAIASVDTGDTIIVHPGIYVENVDFGGKSIVLGSNWLFANDTTAVDSTIIDGNHSGPVVTISNGEDSTTALIGFTLRNGSGAAIGNYNKGGGIYIEGSRPSIRWVNIEDCAADGGWGGGVYISDSDVSLIRTNISRNHAQWGGGISAENSHLILRFTTLIDDSASGSGGGVYLNNVDLNARRFNGFNNVAALDGGGLFATGGSDVVIRLLMLNGNRANLGGALCFSDSSTIQLNNGNINLNNAENGGGIWASAVTGTIGAVRFQNNTAENLGGAMHLSSNSDLEATDMVVINNSANRGGGISILNSVGDFVGGEINNNYAWRGGGIFSNGSDLDFFSITLTQNNSEDIGGGLLSISTNLVMDSTNVTFNSSDSSSGGGIMCINNDSTATYEVVITNSLISRNNANNSGAGLYFRTAGDDSSGMDILIENTRIIRNDGDYYTGLRIYGLNTQFEVNNCTFRGNNAVQFASGAGFNGSCIGSVNHSLFAFNHAAIGGGNFNSGGASVWSGADVDFDHCTFANNTAAYGTALTVGAANAAVTNSIIWGNSTSNHVALDVWDGTGGTLDISYTDLLGGSQAIQLEDTELCSFSWGSGNLNEDPLFCLPDSGNFTLAENSPCVEAAEDRSNLGSFGIGCDPIILSTAGELLPTAYALHQNYPNPFNPVTTIQYDLPDNSQVQVAIYDMLGRKVRTLVSGFENAGFKAVQWQGKNDFGRSVGAGVYIYQIQAGDFLQTRKMILLK